MSQPLSYEDPEKVFFITTRTMSSRLWFVNNRALEEAILGYLAKYQAEYAVKIFAFIMMGNHYHLLAQFPEKNRALFMRSFNSMVARGVPWYVPGHGKQKLWARRYAFQAVIGEMALLERYRYIIANPVSSGLCFNIRDYPAYNSYTDQRLSRVRKFEVLNTKAFNDRRRFDPSAKAEDFMTEYELKYSELPTYGEYARMSRDLVYRKLYERAEEEARKKRTDRELGFGTKDYLLGVIPGAAPKHTKTSTRKSFRPLVFCGCRDTKNAFLHYYFCLLTKFREASQKYLAGDLEVEFPPGTYPPSRVSIA